MEMSMSNNALDRVKKQIDAFLAEFDNSFLHHLYAQIAHGKMLRSRLIFAICGVNDQSVKLCGIVELIQLASLLHDDVIDEAMSRRSKPSLNAVFGNKNAIMLGDALYSKAYFHLLSFPKSIAQSISSCVCSLSSGEIRDVFLAKNFNSSLTEYILMIKEKTASLIASSARSAAILSGFDDEAYYCYGECLGIAFQIVDDILDVTQDEKTLGKPAMNDFFEGKTTLPYILLYDLLNDEEKKTLMHFRSRVLSKEEKSWLFSQFKRHGIIEKSFQYAREYAQSALNHLPQNHNPELENMIKAVIERSF